MDAKRVVASLMLCLCVCLLIGWFTETVNAASDSIMEQKGLGGLLANKRTDESQKPTKVQMWLGIGSIFVMIAVVKYV
jgi:hypothetical protein